MVDVHMGMASLLTVLSDDQGALRDVNPALALDPNNERALSARARIEEASSQGGGVPGSEHDASRPRRSLARGHPYRSP